MMRLVLAALIAIAAVACGGADSAQDGTPVEQTIASEETTALTDYPTVTTPDGQRIWKPPFSEEDIRAATPDGLRQHIVMRQKGQRFVVRIEFSSPDSDGVTIENLPVDANGKPLGAATSARSSWSELESHAHFDVETTTVEKTSITTPLGEHDSLLFTQTTSADGQTHIDRSWFALDLPGAPVRYEKVIDGEEVVTMEIVHREIVKEDTEEAEQ